MSRARVHALDAAAVACRHAEFAAFERGFTYPLGGDRFRIDHGADYLAFFRTLGDPVVFAAEEAGELRGVLVAVRRPQPVSAWYLCDLKVAAGAGAGRGRRLLRAFAGSRLRPTDRAYGVSMDPASGENRLRRLALRCTTPRIATGPTLALWSLDAGAWGRCAPLLERELGPPGLHDPRGVKDIVLLSTGARLPFLHLQHGRLARPAALPAAARPIAADEVVMFCLPEADPLLGELGRIGAPPRARASTLHVGMEDCRWRQVLTSDI
jgi:hypothetical protein